MKISFNWNKNKPITSNFSIDPCLSKEEAAKLKMLNSEQVIDMESEERIKVFTEIIGKEKAIFVNTRLEKDLILKNQQQGFMNWIHGVVDIEPKWRKEPNVKTSKNFGGFTKNAYIRLTVFLR